MVVAAVVAVAAMATVAVTTAVVAVAAATVVALLAALTVTPVAAALVAPVGPVAAVARGGPAALVAVMSATPAGPGRVADGGRDQPDGARPAVGVGRRVSAAIGHGGRRGQGRPQQDRDGQQAPGRGSFHPGIMR